MPSLRELRAEFIKDEEGGKVRRRVLTLAEADGVIYLCPKCFVANKGSVGTHMVLNWFEGKVPDERDPKPGRWNPTGTGLDDLTFVPGRKSQSVLLIGGCGWHGFVTSGRAE